MARAFNYTCRSYVSYNDTIHVSYGLKVLNQKAQGKATAFIFHYSEDCLKFMDRLRQQGINVDIIVTSPPYNVGKVYSGTSYNDSMSENMYLDFMFQVAKSAFCILKPDGSFFLNIGARPSNQFLPLQVVMKLIDVGFTTKYYLLDKVDSHRR